MRIETGITVVREVGGSFSLDIPGEDCDFRVSVVGTVEVVDGEYAVAILETSAPRHIADEATDLTETEQVRAAQALIDAYDLARPYVTPAKAYVGRALDGQEVA